MRIRLTRAYHEENFPFWSIRLQFQMVWKIWSDILKPGSPSGNLEPTFLTILTNKKVFVFTQNNNYSVI